ncbi:MAG: HIT domain-containing protein [archaeon]
MANQPTQEELQNMSNEEVVEYQKKNCVFCKIIKGEIPCHKVYEDDRIIAILDIYPSTKGHTLVLPKDHVPIMPLIPPDTFKHLFRNLKYLIRGVKEGVPSAKSTVFIANGAAAGQQSPHFLFHIIPRNDGDGLNFKISDSDKSQDDILKPLKTNITKIMQSHLQKEGKMPVQPSSKDDLATVIEQSSELKNMLINHPEEVKKGLGKNEQLKMLFKGIDIDKLSKKLKENSEHEKKIESSINSTRKELLADKKKEKPVEDKKDDKLDLDGVAGLFTK